MGGGVPCCDGSDATRLEDVDWETVISDGESHYRVKIEGEWYDVPPNAVVQGPNRAGVALVWPYPEWPPGDATHKHWAIRCFMPGVQG